MVNTARRPRSKKVKKPGWKPTVNMLLFRDELLGQLARGKRFVLKDIAAAVGIAPERISRWHRQPGFTEWLDQAIGDASRRLVNPMHYAQMQQAFTSLPHYQTQLRRLGVEAPLSSSAGGNEAAPRTGEFVIQPPIDKSTGKPFEMRVVNINGTVVQITGIPERAPFDTLPPPRPIATQTPTPGK
jgi:hypothetical protein